MTAISVLYDGWPLVFAPNGAAALHLECLLALHPPQIGAHLALPGVHAGALSGSFVQHILPVANSEVGRLEWEQRKLPRLANKVGACLIHLTSSQPAVLAAGASLLSPTDELDWTEKQASTPARRMSITQRLRSALGQGGLAGLGALLWPEDLPNPEWARRLDYLPAVVAPIFSQPIQTTPELVDLNLPETYILAQPGAAETALRRLLASWSWAAGALGEYYPLLLAGVDLSGADRLTTLLKEYELENSVRLLPSLSFASLAALYQGCSACVHTGGLAPWGSPARLVLACGRPLVGFENRWMDAIAGPAAYLVPGDGTSRESCRALGAALVTVIVEESVAESLSQAAHQRASAWLQAGSLFTAKLGDIYTNLGR